MQHSELTKEQRRELTRFVREAARRHLAGLGSPAGPAFMDELAYGGLFVTIRKAGRLRGCMGRLTGGGSFARALGEVVKLSLHDPRFVTIPLTTGDLAGAKFEVSILSTPRPVADASGLVVGRHGVVISQGSHTGCFLPQVATERGWDLETFLSECCVHKAGLPANAWRDPATRIESFEVEVIGEVTPDGTLAEEILSNGLVGKKERASS